MARCGAVNGRRSTDLVRVTRVPKRLNEAVWVLLVRCDDIRQARRSGDVIVVTLALCATLSPTSQSRRSPLERGSWSSSGWGYHWRTSHQVLRRPQLACWQHCCQTLKQRHRHRWQAQTCQWW